MSDPGSRTILYLPSGYNSQNVSLKVETAGFKGENLHSFTTWLNYKSIRVDRLGEQNICYKQMRKYFGSQSWDLLMMLGARGFVQTGEMW